MSDTTEMVRLIRHAAGLLRAAIESEQQVSGFGQAEEKRRSRTIAAMASGDATLRLVAACMEPESEPAIKAVARVRGLIVEGQAYVRTDELVETLDGAS